MYTFDKNYFLFSKFLQIKQFIKVLYQLDLFKILPNSVMVEFATVSTDI